MKEGGVYPNTFSLFDLLPLELIFPVVSLSARVIEVRVC